MKWQNIREGDYYLVFWPPKRQQVIGRIASHAAEHEDGSGQHCYLLDRLTGINGEIIPWAKPHQDVAMDRRLHQEDFDNHPDWYHISSDDVIAPYPQPAQKGRNEDGHKH